MSLLDNKALKVDDIVNFAWSPTDNYISFWVPEKDPKPARVTILSIPKKEEIAVKNLYSVVTVGVVLLTRSAVSFARCTVQDVLAQQGGLSLRASRSQAQGEANKF